MHFLRMAHTCNPATQELWWRDYHNSEASLGYGVRLCLKNNCTNNPPKIN